MSDLRQRLLAAFQLEQKDHLEQLRSFLDTLEGPSVPSPTEYQEAFRSAHTLKGASRAVDLPVLETIAHHLESVLAALKDGKIHPSPELASALRQVLDGVEDYAGSPGVENRSAPAHLVELIQRLLNNESVSASLLLPAPPHSMEEKTPSKEPSPQGRCALTVRVPASTLEGLSSEVQELRVEASRQADSGQGLRALTERLESLEHDWASLRRKGLTPGLDQAALLDFQMHQCLGTARGLLSDQARHNSVLSRLSDGLERRVRQARMIPARDVLGDLGPVARDLARSQGKLLDFRTTGLEIAVDRQVLGQLHEPLVHMIRNAVDHGLETPDERARQGKNPTGKLELELRIAKNQLVTTLSDDGRGIDLEKVRARAGVLGYDIADDETALLELLLLPEFSTVPKPGKLSGRGLGLSILKQVAEQLQGRVVLWRKQPFGAVVGLQTPLSITVQSLLLMRCEGQIFALPTQAVERLVRLMPEDLTVVGRRSNYLRDGVAIPAVELAQALGLSSRGVRMEDGRLWGVLVNHNEQRFLLAVDGLVAHREEVVSALKLSGYNNPKLSGMFLLEDKSICLVINPARLGECASSGGVVAARADPPVASAPVSESPTVLVVDDSITTRMLERSILENHGYRVVVAVDGEDGLRQLKSHRVDLVISDVQMPVMDGFQLLMAIKADPAISHLPVILLTSCEDRVDRQRGLDLGAEAYLSKQSFDQADLLETVRQIA